MSACATSFLPLIYSSITIGVPPSLTLPLPLSLLSSPISHDQALIMDHTEGVIYRPGIPRELLAPPGIYALRQNAMHV